MIARVACVHRVAEPNATAAEVAVVADEGMKGVTEPQQHDVPSACGG